MTDTSVFDSICTLLDQHAICYQITEHDATHTSEQSAAARGDDLRIGGKALVIKADKAFHLCVIPADRKLDSKRAKIALACRKIRFATRDELFDLTGLVPGSIPPFGDPILTLPLSVDRTLTENSRIAFNAGSLTRSVSMSMEDYLRLARPNVMDLAETGNVK